MAATFSSRITQHVADWRPILGLQDWRIVVQFDNRCAEQGYCIAKPQYEDMVLGFNLRLIRQDNFSAADLEELVVHEMVHGVDWRASERAVTQLARSLLRARYPKTQWALYHE